jgi:hypothetical protein
MSRDSVPVLMTSLNPVQAHIPRCESAFHIGVLYEQILLRVSVTCSLGGRMASLKAHRGQGISFPLFNWTCWHGYWQNIQLDAKSTNRAERKAAESNYRSVGWPEKG